MRRPNPAITLLTVTLVLYFTPFLARSLAAEALFIDQNGKVGIGTNDPQSLLHLFAGSAGTDPLWTSDADTLLIENDGNNYIQFFTPNTANAGLAWSDPENRTIGQLYYAHATNSMHFVTDSSEKMTIDASGNVGIGTTNPGGTLEVFKPGGGANMLFHSDYVDDGNIVGRITAKEVSYYLGSIQFIDRMSASNGAKIRFRQRVSGTNKEVMSINNGTVGIMTTTPGSYTLYVNGPAYSTDSWTGSDKRWKRKITPLKGSLNKITQLHGIKYEWNIEEYPDQGFTEGKQIGLIAQDVEQVIPELVHTNDNGFKSISYEKLTAVLVEAIKELQSENAVLKKRNHAIEARLVVLEKGRK